jgi:bacterioferritin-associated ferredoxin
MHSSFIVHHSSFASLIIHRFPMSPDDELCLCFHVTKRKVLNFLQVEKPRRASQMSECFGAGTGCGWCRPYLRKLFEAAQKKSPTAGDADLPEASQYAAGRTLYVKSGGGVPPPGATPIDG